jgi:hypothetical protein
MEWLLRSLLGFLLRPLFRSLTRFFHDLDDKWRGLGKRDWYLVNGTVEIVKVEPRRDDWVVMLHYSYSVAGEFWSGRTYRVFYVESDADHYAQQHPSGSTVVVRYNPNKASRSVVLKEDQLSASAAGTI